jgi:signal transduction histidine kinase
MARELTMPSDTMERLEQIAALHDVLVRILGHELRTPLSSVVYAARMIGTKPEDLQGTLRRADQIERTARRLDRLIEHVLAFAQASVEGTIPLAHEATSLGEIARRSLAELDPESAARVTLETDGDTRGVWDQRRIGQVLANLIANALEHGEVAGTVRVVLDGREPSCVRLLVHNGGVIPEATLSVIFQPFRARTRLSTGIGLGLFVVERIVRAHGATIEASSSAERGTEFRIALPRSAASAVPSAQTDTDQRP